MLEFGILRNSNLPKLQSKSFVSLRLTGRSQFFLIDQYYNKEANFNIIITSNKNPALYRKGFDEDSTLLRVLDRIFDDATVLKLCGESLLRKEDRGHLPANR